MCGPVAMIMGFAMAVTLSATTGQDVPSSLFEDLPSSVSISELPTDLFDGDLWFERWASDPVITGILEQFAAEAMNGTTNGTTTGTTGAVPDIGSLAPRKISEEGEFRNWASTQQSAPAKVFRPTTVEDIQDILAEARGNRSSPKIRCMGSSHSWSSLFADDGAWLVDTSGLASITWSADSNPTTVIIGPGVTGGDLGTFLDAEERGEWRGMFIESDVLLETVTYGGVINTLCHGTGHTKTVADYVLATSIIKYDGTQVDLRREDDPEDFALKVAHFGLLGVTVSYTLQLDSKRTAIKVTDSKHRAREKFLNMGMLPETAGYNPLLDLWQKHYAVEIFYFAASSLHITDITSTEFEDQEWDPNSDIVFIKAFDRTENPVGRDDDSDLGADPKTSTRFDRNFGITDWIKINLGTELALPLVAMFGAMPSLVALYSEVAALAFEPAGQMTGQVTYETSLAQAIHWQKYISDGFPVYDAEVCIKMDPDFTNAYTAIHSTMNITKTFAEEQAVMPLNVAMEIRFTKHSDSPLSPAYGAEGDVFMWIEILSALLTPGVQEYSTAVVDAWLDITLKDGSQATRPHWAKLTEATVMDGDAKTKKAFADRLLLLKSLSDEFDPTGAFVNNYFDKMFAEE